MRQSAILPLNKPVGVRSTKCVEEVRKALRHVWRDAKVGHGGTLDSSASGLLVILISAATRLSSFVMRMPKVYRATVKLGVETSTCDYTGETLSSSCWRGVSNDDIDHILTAFIGWRLQTPPKVSAVHIGGRRAHEVFRSGGDPDIEPRAVFIEHIQRLGPLSYKGEFGILIKCGKGVYIRSIARDVGRALGCGAHLSSLTRESVGGFTLHSALKFDGNRCLDFDNLRSFLMPLTVLEEFLPTYSLPEEGMTRLSNGLGVSFSLASRRTFGKFPPNGALAFSSGPLLSIAHLESREGELYALPDVNIFDKTTTGTHI